MVEFTPRMVHNFPKAVSVWSLCPNAHKYPQIPIQKEKGTTQGILVSCLNNTWYYTTPGLYGGTKKNKKRYKSYFVFVLSTAETMAGCTRRHDGQDAFDQTNTSHYCR